MGLRFEPRRRCGQDGVGGAGGVEVPKLRAAHEHQNMGTILRGTIQARYCVLLSKYLVKQMGWASEEWGLEWNHTVRTARSSMSIVNTALPS